MAYPPHQTYYVPQGMHQPQHQMQTVPTHMHPHAHHHQHQQHWQHHQPNVSYPPAAGQQVYYMQSMQQHQHPHHHHQHHMQPPQVAQQPQQPAKPMHQAASAASRRPLMDFMLNPVTGKPLNQQSSPPSATQSATHSPQPPTRTPEPSTSKPPEAKKGCGCKRINIEGHVCVDFCSTLNCDGSCERKGNQNRQKQNLGVPRNPTKLTKVLAPLKKEIKEPEKPEPEKPKPQPQPVAESKPWVPPKVSYTFNDFADEHNGVIQNFGTLTDIVPLKAFLNKYSHEWDPDAKQPSGNTSNVISASKSNMSAMDKMRRECQSVLNKLTPEKYEQLMPEMNNLVIEALQNSSAEDGDKFLAEIVRLVYEAAVRDQCYAQTYARMCETVCYNEVKTTGTERQLVKSKFRRSLINKCQKEFESLSKERPPPPPEDDDSEGEDYRETENQKHRKRAAANINFVGELFKLSLLTEKIMHQILKTMLFMNDDRTLPEEDHLEITVQLLKTIGAKLEENEPSKAVDDYIARLSFLHTQEKYTKRIMYLIKDVIELRESKWEPRNRQDGPRPLTEFEDHSKRIAGGYGTRRP